MIDCIADIELWCRSHGLKLNANKSDVIWLGTRQQLADKDIPLLDVTLQASMTARNLELITDQQLMFDAQARTCSRACFYQLRRI